MQTSFNMYIQVSSSERLYIMYEYQLKFHFSHFSDSYIALYVDIIVILYYYNVVYKRVNVSLSEICTALVLYIIV